MVDQAIWSKKMSNGVRRTPVSAEQVRIMRERKLLHILLFKLYWGVFMMKGKLLLGEQLKYRMLSPAEIHLRIFFFFCTCVNKGQSL